MPKYATVFMVFMLGSVGLPGTSGFVGEFLTLLGMFKVDTTFALLATTGVVLGAAYMLVLYKRVVFGAQDNKDAAEMPDLGTREFAIFVPLVLLVIYLGVSPGFVMDRISPSVEKLQGQYLAGLEAGAAVGVEPAAGDYEVIWMPEVIRND